MKYTLRGDAPFCRDWSDKHVFPGEQECEECHAWITSDNSECLTVTTGRVLVCKECADKYWHWYQMNRLVRTTE